jgi:hypothetical protein
MLPQERAIGIMIKKANDNRPDARLHYMSIDSFCHTHHVAHPQPLPLQDTFAGMIEDAGFQCVSYENILGGVAALHSGFKLPAPPPA